MEESKKSSREGAISWNSFWAGVYKCREAADFPVFIKFYRSDFDYPVLIGLESRGFSINGTENSPAVKKSLHATEIVK